jgi:hypothetical protein
MFLFHSGCHMQTSQGKTVPKRPESPFAASVLPPEAVARFTLNAFCSALVGSVIRGFRSETSDNNLNKENK